MGFTKESYDESIYSTLVAKVFKTDHTHLVFNENSFLTLLPKVIQYLDEPIGDQALLPVYWLAEQSKNKLKVVLSGEGGDEIFGGYDYYRRFTDNKDMKYLLSKLISKNVTCTPSGFPLVASMDQAYSLLNNEFTIDNQDWEKSYLSWINTSNNSIQRANAADLASWLPDDLLVKFDRMTMANSIEGRAPFLDPKIVEFGINLDNSQKIFGKEKVILKNIAEKLLPKDIIRRKKQGFILPMEDWIKSFFEQTSIKDFIEDCDFPYFNKLKLNLVIGTNLSNPRFVFSIIMLLSWHKNFFKD
jgi:asparagine synthase (glutamine-hydrolysing)